MKGINSYSSWSESNVLIHGFKGADFSDFENPSAVTVGMIELCSQKTGVPPKRLGVNESIIRHYFQNNN